MKVLLIHPFLTVCADDPSGIGSTLGLGYLAAYLEKEKILVEILDIAAEGIGRVEKIGEKARYGLSEKEIKERIKKISPDIIGITCISTLHAQDAHETARIAKEVNSKILVVMGGAHPSANSREVLKDKNVDIVVRGEGEITLFEIVKNFKEGKSLDNIAGTSRRMGKRIIENPMRPPVSNIDALPFPARHLLPMEIYFKDIRQRTNYAMRDRAMTMISSRGCPGSCVYCAVRTVWGRFWRGRSPKNVVDEIESIIRDFGANEIHFIDDSISVSMKRLDGICDEIIKRKLDIKWTTPNGIAIWLLNKNLMKKMKKAGCYRLTFGLESGNPDTLHNFIGKHYDYNKAKEIIKFASGIGLWTIGTFIIGFPHETREKIEDTINFALSTDLDFAVFYIANPFPGTPMYDIYLHDGLLPSGGVYEVVRGCRTKYFTHGKLKTIQSEAFSRFLRSRMKKPWRFIHKIKSGEDLVYTLKIGRNLSKIILNSALVKNKGIAALWR